MQSVYCVLLFVLVLVMAEARQQNHSGNRFKSRKRAKFQEVHCSDVSDNHTQDYQTYLRCHHSNYKPDRHHHLRLASFNRCRDAILNHDPDERGYSIGLSQFCHWTDNEFNDSLNQVAIEETRDDELPNIDFRQMKARDTTTFNFSWVDKGAVTPAKRQGQCGNCYAFAAIGAVEGAYFIKYGVLYNLSSQQYTDCTVGYYTKVSYKTECNYTYAGKTVGYVASDCVKRTINTLLTNVSRDDHGNDGCHGGWYYTCWAYNNVTEQKLNTMECYTPYSDVTLSSGACSYSANCSGGVAVTGYVRVPKFDEVELLKAVNIGPVACTLDGKIIKDYSGGILSGNSTSTSHAILLVGYGTTASGQNYWLVKNSWGPKWGLNGYLMVARGENALNIAAYCYYPIIA